MVARLMIEINTVRLYLPETEFKRRVGEDPNPLTDYIRRLAIEAEAFWQNRVEPTAGGVLAAIGVGPGRESRSWCEAVSGEMPAEELRALEEQLDSISPLIVQHGPIAFGIELRLAGKAGFDFPMFPSAWSESAQKAGRPVTIPDGLFELIWPEGMTSEAE
jgi:hypothetical protein